MATNRENMNKIRNRILLSTRAIYLAFKSLITCIGLSLVCLMNDIQVTVNIKAESTNSEAE